MNDICRSQYRTYTRQISCYRFFWLAPILSEKWKRFQSRNCKERDTKLKDKKKDVYWRRATKRYSPLQDFTFIDKPQLRIM